MTPYTTIYIWVESKVQSNSVVTTVYSTLTKVTFGDSKTNISLDYDPHTGKFIASDNTTLDEGLALNHLIPELT